MLRRMGRPRCIATGCATCGWWFTTRSAPYSIARRDQASAAASGGRYPSPMCRLTTRTSTVPSDPEAYSQDISIDDLNGLVKQLGIEQAHIVGFSMGGNVDQSNNHTYALTALRQSVQQGVLFAEMSGVHGRWIHRMGAGSPRRLP